jgi:hypothetical protein
MKKFNLGILSTLSILIMASCGNNGSGNTSSSQRLEAVNHMIDFSYKVSKVNESYSDAVKNLNQIEVTQEYKLYLEWDMTNVDNQGFINYIFITFKDPDITELNRGVLEPLNAFGDGIRFELIEGEYYRASYLQTATESTQIFDELYVLIKAPTLINGDQSLVDVRFGQFANSSKNRNFIFNTTGINRYSLQFRLMPTSYGNLNSDYVFFLANAPYKTLRINIPLGNSRFNLKIHKEASNGLRGDLLTATIQDFNQTSHPQAFSDSVRFIDFNVMTYLLNNSNFLSLPEYLAAVEGTEDAKTIIVLTFFAAGNYKDTIYEVKWEVGK